ncbi:IS4 family transposase [Desulfitispora alkaliphila]|uniref:IS4 family transposase n=1 Tax=Desulfitispora alkaliphila TaxID=622674 RepID=UPI003D194EC2
MQGKDIINSTFHQLFRPIFSKNFYQQLTELEVDKYVKKLKTDQLLKLFVNAQLEQYRGLRDISNNLNDDQFSQAINLDSISASQLSRRLRKLNPKIVQQLFYTLIREANKGIGFNSLRQTLGRLYLIDSSTISLSLTRYQWAKFRKTKSGVKLHLCLNFCDGEALPEKAVVTQAKPADKTQMDALVVLNDGALNVFDRAYVDYKTFDVYCANGTRFVSRLKNNALVEVVEERPVKPESPIIKDQIVKLGKDKTTKMEHQLRLVETKDTEGNPIIIVTNDFEQEAEAIGEIYRCRWQIELFFKWLKQHLKIKHFYGLSKEAVENQIYIALITYCLLMLLKSKVGYDGPLLTIKRLLSTCLHEPLSSFIKKLYHKNRGAPRVKRRINHGEIFEITLRQVIELEADHLYDDRDYDPVIL